MKIKILSTVFHDGKEYSKGEKISLADEHASRLISIGAAEEIKKKNSSNEGDNANAQGSDQ